MGGGAGGELDFQKEETQQQIRYTVKIRNVLDKSLENQNLHTSAGLVTYRSWNCHVTCNLHTSAGSCQNLYNFPPPRKFSSDLHTLTG